MEGKNQSSIHLQVGEPFEQPKQFAKVHININSQASNQAQEKFANLIKNPKSYAPVIFQLEPEGISPSECAEKLREICSKSKFLADSKSYTEFEVIDDGSSVYLIFIFTEFAKVLPKQIKMFQKLGGADIVEKQENSLKVSYESALTFSEIQDFIKSKEVYSLAMLRSLKLAASLDLDQNLVEKALELLTSLEPAIAQSPLPLLKFFRNLKLDFSFKSTSELDDSFKKSEIFENYKGHYKFGFSKLMKKVPGHLDYVQDIANIVKSNVNIHFYVPSVGYVLFESNLPGISENFAFDYKSFFESED